MLKTRLVVLSSLALLAMLVGLVACGGGTSGLIDADLSADDAFMGITSDDFKVVRSNDAGYRDSALNRTLDLQSVSRGDVTVVTISVTDTDPMYGVTLELNYDPSKYNPQSVEFMGLVDTPIELATTRVNGLVAAGQVDVNGPAVRSGEFVTVTFANEPSRVNKATSAVHAFALDHLYEPGTMETAGGGIAGWTYTEPEEGDPGPYTLHATWAVGDGNSDGGTTIADITQIIAHGYYEVSNVVDDDFAPATADYNGDGRVTVADITPIGQNIEAFYSEIHIAIGDDDEFLADDTPLVVLDRETDSTAPIPPFTAPTTDWDEVFRNWSGEIADADMAANKNASNEYWLAARLSDGTDHGDWTVLGPYIHGDGPPPPPDFVVDTFTITATGATGGTGSEGAHHFLNGDDIMAPANSTLDLALFSIAGTYQGTPFDGDDGTAPTAEYDTALAAAADLLTWTPENAGHEDMWMTADVLVITDSTATVFPDDDEEAAAEGTLEVTMGTSGTFVPGDISYEFDVDVDADPVAPEIMDIETSAGEDGTDWFLNQAGNTDIVCQFNFGTGGEPDPLSGVGAALFDLTDMSEAVAFTYTADPPGTNEFQILTNPGPESSHILLANLGGGNVVSGHTYCVRIMDGVYNSVNKPSSWLTVAGPPPAVTFSTIPVDGNVNPDDDSLWIFYPEPKIRRNPRATYNIATDEIQPEDQEAYDDIIRMYKGVEEPADEFFYENAGGTLHPKVIVVMDSDPSGIDYDDAGEAGVVKAYTCPGYLVVDIAVLTTGGGPGTEPEDYGFAVFTADEYRLGGGNFTVHFDPFTPLDPTGIDWGINIYDDAARGDLVGPPMYTLHEVSGPSALSTTPDVLWVEFGQGVIGNFDEPQADAPNCMVRLHHDTEGDLDLMWDPRMITGGAGGIIMVHGFQPLDWSVPGSPGVGGPLDTGLFFDVQLVDPTGAVTYETLPNQLAVTGANPNE